MGRVNVEYNGRWACFSTIVDSLITPFMNLEDYEQWRKEELGRVYYNPIMERNTRSIEEVISIIYMVHGREKTITLLVDCGLSLEEAESLVCAEEVKNYQPVQDGDKYFCPNCGSEVKEGMERCSVYGCEHGLVWG